MPGPAIYFYDVVLSIHIMAVVLAFGVTFAYPIIGIYITREHPGSLPAIHAVQERIGKFLITPAATIALIAGFYLASDRDYMGKVWVIVPLIILIVLLGLGGAFFGPSERRARERRAGELAERDLAAGGTLSAEYTALAGRVAKVGGLANVLILVAIFFMAAKPGGY